IAVPVNLANPTSSQMFTCRYLYYILNPHCCTAGVKTTEECDTAPPLRTAVDRFSKLDCPTTVTKSGGFGNISSRAFCRRIGLVRIYLFVERWGFESRSRGGAISRTLVLRRNAFVACTNCRSFSQQISPPPFLIWSYSLSGGAVQLYLFRVPYRVKSRCMLCFPAIG
ncbi:unnamed protein product, partial [Ectocarpus sp. 4 AP-2014]